MHRFTSHYDLAPDALHRAVSYIDRFLSAKKIIGGNSRLRLLGTMVVFAAAMYENKTTCRRINADIVTAYVGCSWRDILEAERELVAVLWYRLSGPMMHTFVDDFLRNEDSAETVIIRTLAYHLADMAPLDYRCVAFLPSAVAASAIVLARATVLGYNSMGEIM
ncbi:unnamed protein product [Urochloa humidicola]